MDQAQPTRGLSEERHNEERLRQVIDLLYQAASEVEGLLAETQSRIDRTGECDDGTTTE